MNNTRNIWNNEYNPFQGFKVLAWYERMKKIQSGNFDPPVNIALDLCQGTQHKKKCNGFNCNFCMSNWEPENKAKEAEIPYEILMKIPHFLFEWGVKSICIPGHNSDPTSYDHNNQIDFIRSCNRYDIDIGYNTNGFAMSKYLMEELCRICNWIGISINSGTKEDHERITGSKTFDKIIDNIKYMSSYIKEYRLNCDIGYKYLITDDNQNHIYDAIELASKIGIRHMQIRPCDLPIERSSKININNVEKQIKEGLKLEREDFEIFGVKEKFSSEYKKITPKRCISSPLGSTWMADGSVIICPDRRWSRFNNDMILCNYIEEGLESIRKNWGGKKHIKMIEAVNKDIHNCHRCTLIHWHRMYEHTIENDDMDVTLI